jgi:S1-C subfamily serine protease
VSSWFSTPYRKLWGAIGGLGIGLLVIGLFASLPGQSQVGGRLAGDVVSRVDWASQLADSANSVFFIEAQKCDGTSLGTGTGFLSENWLITNAHVIEDASRVSLRSQNGQEFDARSWTINDDLDLALITFEFDGSAQLSLASEDPREGSLVATVGHPLGGDLEIRDGRVLKYLDGDDFGERDGKYLGLTSEALPGDSGGPVIGSSGRVVGVTSALLRKDNVTVAIPVETLMGYLDDVGDSTFTFPCQ